MATPPDERTELRGALRLIGDGVDATTAVVQAMHRAINAGPFDVLEAVPVARPVVSAVRLVNDTVRDTVYGTVRGASRLVFIALDAAIEHGAPGPTRALPGGLLAAVRGVLGDHLARANNPLAIAMHARRDGHELELTREALAISLADATPRLAVFVHGLACDESCWARGGGDAVNYARRLERELGFTTVFVRYNTGLTVAESGRALAALMRALVAGWPVALERVALVGHSMGGLVARSACHHGAVAGDAWSALVRDLACIGSPHLGSPYEKLGAAASAVLAAIDVTAPLAQAADVRSAGIRNMHDGAVLDDAAVAPSLPAGTRVHHVASSVHRALGWAVGDGMVRVASAAPGGADNELRLEGRHHMELLEDAAVGDALCRWLA